MISTTEIFTYIYIFFTVMMRSFYDILDDLDAEPLNKPTPVANFIKGILWPVFLPITIGKMVGVFSSKYLKYQK